MNQPLQPVIKTKTCCLTKLFELFLCILFLNNVVYSQKEFNVLQGWIQFSDARNSMYHYLADQAYSLLENRSDEMAKLLSLPAWQQRQQWLHKTFLNIVGAFPEKTPLNANIERTLSKDNYKVEHIIFESQPGFYVTSSLFIPNNLKNGKAPAIIYCSGHSDDAYRNPEYQRAILNLVEKGFIVFAFDPIGQGERLQYYDSATKTSYIKERDQEHSYAGAQLFITGSSLARYMIWDGMRAIDYLITRKEVDTSRIGITGRSGGGTQSAYIAAFDNRIKVLVTESYITNFKRLIQSSGPQCAEQDMFHAIKSGMDMADLVEVRAPLPTMIISTTRDATFSIQGAIETADEVLRIYQAYNKQNDFRLVIDDAPHASTKKDREAMYAFFQKYLMDTGDSTDKEVKLLSAEELQVTKTGQVTTSLGSETVFSLNQKVLDNLNDQLQPVRKNFPRYLSNVIESAKKLSGYQEPLKINQPVFTGRLSKENYAIEKYFVKSEGDYVIPYLLIKPNHPTHRGLIYLNPSGKSTEALPGQEIEWFVSIGFTVLAPDLLGYGEIGPGDFRGDSYIHGVSYNVWFLSMLINRSIVGIQAGDIVKLTSLLRKETNEVYAIAIKELSPALLHAAAFDTMIKHIALIESYSSYRSLVLNHYYNSNYVHSAVPAALTAYDLPDLAASLAPRKLMIAGPRDGAGTRKDSTIINEDLSIIKAAYHYKKADGNLEIYQAEVLESREAFYRNWIK
ncbi:MAG TPA: acetylxylan esterase [Chitinophagaceae bacterium]|nr:acetylxylan esterase [Chitinophagaceae bacterium]